MIITKLIRRFHFKAFRYGLAPIYLLTSDETGGLVFRKTGELEAALVAFRSKSTASKYITDVLHDNSLKPSRISYAEFAAFMDKNNEGQSKLILELI